MKLDNIWKVKPIKILDSNIDVNTNRAHTLKDSSGLPPPTKQQLDMFSKNHKNIIDTTVLKSLKTHRNDVLHGSQSLNMLLRSKRPAHDWDMYSPTERKRARALEKSIDRKAGCDIAEVRYTPIPKSPFVKSSPDSSSELYRVYTPLIKNDADIDIMDKPRGLRTFRKGGITHESLVSQYSKKVKGIFMPMRMMKSSIDKRRIETEHPELRHQQYNSRGIPLLQDTDKDFYMDCVDCDPNDSTKGGLLGGLIRRRKARKDIELAIEHDMKPSEEMIQQYSGAQEEVSTATANVEMNMEQGIHDVSEHIKELPGQFRENIKGVGKEIDKGFSSVAKSYIKRADGRQSDPYGRKSIYQRKDRTPTQHPMESPIHRGYAQAVTFNVRGFEGKMFGDSSIPDQSYHQSIPKYQAFHPHTVGSRNPQGYIPHRAPNPPYIQEKNRQRELARLHLREQMILNAQRGE